MMNARTCFALVTVVSTLVLQSPPLLFAQPALINYQGRLVDGTNLINGNVGLSLRLYNVASGGTVLLEDSNTVSVVDGLYSTLIGDNVDSEILGALTLPEVLTNPVVYLETAVNGVALSPRERMVSVAYALRADHAGSVQPPIDITYSNFPDSVLRIANNGGGPAIWAEATNASAIFGVNWGDGNALFVANAGSGPSAIFQGGNVGIGTQTPEERLAVNGRLYSIQGGVKFPDGTVQDSAASDLWQEGDSGGLYTMQQVGIGATSPSNSLHIEGAYGIPAVQWSASRVANLISNINFTATNNGLAASQSGTGASWSVLANMNGSDNVRSIVILTNKSNYAGSPREFYAKSILVTNLGMNIPTNAIILRVGVILEMRHSLTSSCDEVSAKFVANPVVNGIPSPSLSSFTIGDPSTSDVERYSTRGKFGIDWTPAMINSSSFGFAISPFISLSDLYYSSAYDYQPDYLACDPVGTPQLEIDRLRVEVDYRFEVPFEQQLMPGYVAGIAENSDKFTIQTGAKPVTNNAASIFMATNGFVGIGTENPTVRLTVNGGVFATGAINGGSDINTKKNIEPADPQSILDRLTAMPLHTWTYKAEDDTIRHIGPMAQDFHAAFGLGVSDTSIATVDADGVALAAIQALAKENEGLKEQVSGFGVQVSELEEENRALREELEAIKRKLGM